MGLRQKRKDTDVSEADLEATLTVEATDRISVPDTIQQDPTPSHLIKILFEDLHYVADKLGYTALDTLPPIKNQSGSHKSEYAMSLRDGEKKIADVVLSREGSKITFYEVTKPFIDRLGWNLPKTADLKKMEIKARHVVRNRDLHLELDIDKYFKPYEISGNFWYRTEPSYTVTTTLGPLSETDNKDEGRTRADHVGDYISLRLWDQSNLEDLGE